MTVNSAVGKTVSRRLSVRTSAKLGCEGVCELVWLAEAGKRVRIGAKVILRLSEDAPPETAPDANCAELMAQVGEVALDHARTVRTALENVFHSRRPAASSRRPRRVSR